MIEIEVRDNDEVTISGYVNAVGRDSKPLRSVRGLFVEQIRPGTFDKALRRAENIEIMFNHQRSLGGTKSGNLSLREDNIGLFARAVIRDAEVAAAAIEKRLRGWSFGFRALADEWEENPDKLPRRYLDDMELDEVSVLTKEPAYYGTSIEAREDNAQFTEVRCFANEVFEMRDLRTNEPEAVPKTDYSLQKKRIEIEKMKGTI